MPIRLAGMKEAIAHVDLSDMPDVGGTNSDHDLRYLKLDQQPTPQTLTASPILNWGTSGRIPFYSSTKTLSDDSNLNWDNTNKRLGIGTASPSYRLDISGQLQALLTTGVGFGAGYRSSSWIGGVSGNPAMMLQNGSGKWCFVDLSSGTMEVINGGNYDLVLGANNSVYAYVKSDGKFGIRTSSPSAQLEVTTSGQLALRMNRTVTNGSFRYDFNAIDDPSETQYPGYTAYANLEAYLDSTRIPFEFAPGIMAIKTGAAQWAMFLDDNQNIYLGTNTDDGTSSRLQTNGTVSALTGGFISQMTSDLTIDGSMWYRTDLYELRFRLDGVTYRANVSPIS
jgi:hypothetical protein